MKYLNSRLLRFSLGVIFFAFNDASTSLFSGPIHEAVKNGCFDVIEMIIAEEDIDVINTRDEDGVTPIHIAVALKNYDMVSFLIENNANVNIRNNTGDMPLHYAVALNECDIIELLLTNGADANALAGGYMSPLHWAAYLDYLDAVDILIRHGADVNVIGAENSPIHFAAQRGNLRVIQRLVDAGAIVDCEIQRHFSSMHESARSFAENGVSQKEWIRPPLHDAAYAGHIEVVKFLIKQGANLNSQDAINMTPMHNASAAGNIEIVKLLVSLDAYINPVNCENKTPLDYAKDKNQTPVIDYLTSIGAI